MNLVCTTIENNIKDKFNLVPINRVTISVLKWSYSNVAKEVN